MNHSDTIRKAQRMIRIMEWTRKIAMGVMVACATLAGVEYLTHLSTRFTWLGTFSSWLGIGLVAFLVCVEAGRRAQNIRAELTWRRDDE